MQAVILAAGKGTRMADLTTETPKPLLKIAGKNLIEHKLAAMPDEITEIILVIGHKANAIQEYFGNSFGRFKIKYAYDHNSQGTAYALWQAKDLLESKFVVMMGDDLYGSGDISEIIKYNFAMKIKKAPGFLNVGNVLINDRGFLEDIKFERHNPPETVNMDIGLYALGKEIFNYPIQKIPGKNEFGLPHTLLCLAKHIPIRVLEANFWMKINTQQELKNAEDYLLSNPLL